MEEPDPRQNAMQRRPKFYDVASLAITEVPLKVMAALTTEVSLNSYVTKGTKKVLSRKKR